MVTFEDTGGNEISLYYDPDDEDHVTDQEGRLYVETLDGDE